MERLRPESMLSRIIAAAAWVQDVLHSVLFTVFLGLVGMMLAAYLGAGWRVIIGAGAVGLMIGAAVSKRLWFGETKQIGRAHV
jgi:adenine/guanine phosphoribosyltransferase-like PRPP-binding protein